MSSSEVDHWAALLSRNAAASRPNASLLILGASSRAGVPLLLSQMFAAGDKHSGKRTLLNSLNVWRHHAAGIADSAHNLPGCGSNGIGVASIPATQPKSSTPSSTANLLDVSTSLDVWIVNDCASPGQFASCVAAARPSQSLAVVCLDMSRPWTAMQQAESWLLALQKAANNKDTSAAPVSKQQLELLWRVCRSLGMAQVGSPNRHRSDSGATASSSSSSSSESSDDSSSSDSDSADAHADERGTSSASAQASSAQANASAHAKSIPGVLAAVQEADAPIPPGVMLQCAGMPVLLVPTKLDCTSPCSDVITAHADLSPAANRQDDTIDLSARQLDVIVADLRRLALRWGAGFVASAAVYHHGSECLLGTLCRTAAVLRCVTVQGQAAMEAFAPLGLAVGVAGVAHLCLPPGADSTSLVHDSLAVYTGAHGEVGEEDMETLTTDMIVQEYGEQQQGARAAQMEDTCSISPRFRLFRTLHREGGVRGGGDKSQPSRALLMGQWLKTLAQEHPSAVSSGGSTSAAAAATRALAGAAKDNEQALQRLAAEERKRQTAASTSDKQRLAKSQVETRETKAVSKETPGDEGKPTTKSQRPKKAKTERGSRKAAEGSSAAAASAEASTSAADFFASMLSSPEPKAKDKPKTRSSKTRAAKKASAQ